MENRPLRSLTNRHQFLRLKQSGQRIYPSKWMLISYAPTASGEEVRLGITISRKVGKAVVRNRLKRWAREYFRRLKAEDKSLVLELNLILRPQSASFYEGLSHDEFDKALERGWRKLKKDFLRQP